MKKIYIPFILVFVALTGFWVNRYMAPDPLIEKPKQVARVETKVVEPAAPEGLNAGVFQPHLHSAPPASPQTQASEITFEKEGSVNRILEKLAEATINQLDSQIVSNEIAGSLDKRFSLIETSMKHPFLIVEEEGRFFDQPEESIESVRAQVATHFMLQVRPGTNLVVLQEKLSALNCTIGEKLNEDNFIVNLDHEPSIDEHIAKRKAIQELEEFVEVVEPDYYVYAIGTPDDSRLLELWGMHNTGQTGGTEDKDIDAPEAWNINTGSRDVLVGVIDTGVDRDHEDLLANMWTNPNEIPGNGKDDDGNGFVDDVYGWDFYNNDNNPHDDNSHGTHCAGTIGGVGNNGKGVVGVCWETSMVGIKFLGGSGGGFLSDGVKSIAYATKIGVQLTSNSWGGGGYSASMKKAIDEAAEQGIGFVAAAGNHSGNNDKYPSYPASYESENVISVGANNHKGKSAYFSCYGKTSVDLFAPGVNTLSTTPGNQYASFSGTSMATPHVAGAYALVLSANPSWNAIQVKDALMESVDVEDSLSEKCVTGGRLNVFHALSSETPDENLIAVKPTEIDFGQVSVNQLHEMEFILSNPGSAPTTVTELYIEGTKEDTNDLIGHWPLNGDALDATGNGHDGQVFNAIPTTDRFGRPNQAYAFDGDGDFIEIAHSDSLNAMPISISVWYNSTDDGINREAGIVSKYIAAHWNGWQVAEKTSSEMFPWYLRGHYKGVIGEYGEEPFEVKVKRDMWNHIVTVFDEEGGRIYLNGQLSDSHNWRGDYGKCTTYSSLQFGRYRHWDPSSRHWDFSGSIDDVRIYGASLTNEDVQKIYSDENENSAFSVVLETPLTLEPNSAHVGIVTFESNRSGLHQANLIAISDAQNEPKLVVPLTAEVIASPELEINPENMHFGLADSEIQKETIQLKNIGNGELNYALEVKSDQNWLRIAGDTEGRLISGEEIIINVLAYANEMTSDYEKSHILIRSNDPSSPETVVTVTAELITDDGGLVFRPSSLEFEETYVGQSSKKNLEISNSGTEPITISRFAFRNSAFSHHLSLPVTLDSGEKMETYVHFTPKQAGDLKSSALLLTLERGGKSFVGTGMNSDGEKLDQGQVDPHWQVTGPTEIKRLKISPWAKETSTAGWLGNENGGTVPDIYIFRNSFDLSGCNLSNLSMQGLMSVDNGASVEINQQDIGYVSEGFQRIGEFSLKSTRAGLVVNGNKPIDNPLRQGLNEIVVKVRNTGGPVGLFVDQLAITTSKSHSYQVEGKAAIAPAIAVNPVSVSESLVMNEVKNIELKIKNEGGSTLDWSLKGATGMGGKSFSLGQVFGLEHFAPLAKGEVDSRAGAPVSILGGGPDYFGYSWSDSNDPAGPNHQWRDISKDGEHLSELSDSDDGNHKITLPFAMEFYGEKFETMFVNANGFVTFSEASEEYGHFPLPSAMMPSNLVAAFATDLNPGRGGDIYVSSENDQVIVQYTQVKDFAGLGEYTFQISLNRNGVIRFHYENMDGATNRSTTGIQNASQDLGLLVAYNNEQITSGTTVRIATSPKWLHTSKVAGSLEAGNSEEVKLTLKAGKILAGKYGAEIEIQSNDPFNSKVVLPVTITIEESRKLVASATELNFGEVEVGTSKSMTVDLSNDGNAPVTISSITIPDSQFSSNRHPKKLLPGQSKEVKYFFKPEQGGDFQTDSTVVSNAQNSPLSILLEGVGLATPKLEVAPEMVKVTLEAGEKTDEIVVLDNSEGKAEGVYEVSEIRDGTIDRSRVVFKESGDSSNETIPADPFSSEHVPGELIVSFKNGKTTFDQAGKLGNGFSIARSIGTARKPGQAGRALSGVSLVLVKVDKEESLREVASRLATDPAVDFVEPNYVMRHTATPNDPQLAEQWALPNIQASDAWKITKGKSSVVVAVIDTGIDYNHPDLQGNIWMNPGEIADNGIDDDGNGFIDDVYGWDFCNNDNDPMDGNKHGTHVAGTIAAATNNGLNVAGVAWETKLVGLKFLSDGGWGSTSDAIDCMAYCVAMDIPISNNSWGGGGYSQAMKDVITESAEMGHLFCAAAGNSSNDNDKRAFYPATYDCPNVLSVAASNSKDALAYFSCFGKTTVDLAAPGVNILNLTPNGGTGSLSGTSMASPHVAGAAALLLSQNPEVTFLELKNILLNSVDPIDAFKDKMVSGGRLNLLKAVETHGPNWLEVSPTSGSVVAGGKTNLTFAINAENLVAGTKQAVVSLKTNDPLAQTIEVPVHLTITGTPEIEVDPTYVSFGELWTGEETTRFVTILNTGTDVLEISNLEFGHDAFSSEFDGLSLKPQDEHRLEILAKPLASESISTSLIIESNDPKQGRVDVQLELRAVTPPSLSYDPALVTLTLEPGQTGEELVSIINSGEATGEWKGQIVETNKKRTRSRDFGMILAGLNQDGRSPDFLNPGLPAVGAGLMTADENSTFAIREDGGNPESLEIAVLGADFQNFLDDVRTGLVETDRFAGVTSINVKNITPTLAELDAFDALIVYNNYRYADNTKLGDNLADYADSGKGVVAMVFESSEKYTPSLAGKWEDGQYGVFDNTNQDTRNWSELGEVIENGHPLVQDVESFKGYYRLTKKGVRAHSKLVAEWKDGIPMIAYREDKGNIMGINFFPPSKRVWDKGWETETDGWTMMANALEWTARGGSPKWITGSPLKGVVEGSKTESMTLSFNASELEEGNYTAEVQFSSNDPVNPYFPVEVILTVRENRAPIAEPANYTLNEDETITFDLKASDPDGDSLTYEVIDTTSNGVLSGESTLLTYAPQPNFHGNDRLTFRVSDGRKQSELAEISFEVLPVNDAPWSGPVEINGTEDEFFVVDFQYGDPDGDHVDILITQYPENGFLWEEFGEWLYFPDNHYNGSDSFKYVVHDGETESEEATVRINLTPANDAPVARNLQVETDQNLAVTVELNASDVDGDTLTYSIVTQPKHGLLEKKSVNQWTYQPFEQYTGTDSFGYRASDSMVEGNLALVSVVVNKVNNPPMIQASTFSVEEDGSLPIKLVASDPDGDELTFIVTKDPANGKLVGKGPSYVYAPDGDFYGEDTFEVKASDGELESNATTITLKVEGKNDAPYFVKGLGILSTGLRETPYRLKFEVADPENDELEVSIAKDPENGTCYFENHDLVFLPAPGFEGLENISLEVSDGEDSQVETFTVNILRHSNPVPITINTEKPEFLMDLLYQANAILARSANYLLELDMATETDTLTGTVVNEMDNESAKSLDEWTKEMEANGDITGAFDFLPIEEENGLSWMVAPFSSPAFSVDTDLLNPPNYTPGANELDKGSEVKDEAQEEEDVVEAQEEEDQSEVAEMDTEPTQLESEAATQESSAETIVDDSVKADEMETPEIKVETKQVPVLANQKADSTKEINEIPSIMESVPVIDNGKNQEIEVVETPTVQEVDYEIDEAIESDTTIEEFSENNASIEEKMSLAEQSFTEEVTEDWLSTPGLGMFFDAGNGWVYQPSIGWCFLQVCPDNCSYWVYSEGMGWLWFSNEVSGMTYAKNDWTNGWIYFNGNSIGESKYLFDYNNETWMTW